jgi:3-hydroxybutyryl-CoA dehydratase
VKGLFLEDLSVGQSAELTKTVDAAGIESFAQVTGDVNPVHLDEAYAATTPFKTRIAHGMLSAGYISAVIGTKLPGPGAIYVSQTMRFKRPVKIGDEVTARATITEIDQEKARITLETVCTVGDKAVVEGEAIIMVPRREG